MISRKLQQAKFNMTRLINGAWIQKSPICLALLVEEVKFSNDEILRN